MAPRWKKLLGIFILLPGLTAYLFLAAAIGERVPNIAILQVLYYLTAGIAWALPAGLLLKWVNAGSSRNGTQESGPGATPS